MREVPIEMLLANLQKRKKVTLFENYQQQQNKRPRLQSTSDSWQSRENHKECQTDAYMDNPNTSNTAPNSLAVIG